MALIRLLVWVLETLCEAFLLSGFLLVLFGGISDPGPRGLIGEFWLGIRVALAGFVITGYFASALMLRLFWTTPRLWLYSTIGAAVAIIHLQIFYLEASGQSWLERRQLQAASAFIIFACTYGGSLLLRKLQLTFASHETRAVPPHLSEGPIAGIVYTDSEIAEFKRRGLM